MTSPVQNTGTQPLTRPTPPAPPKVEPPKQAMPIKNPTASFDANTARAGDVSPDAKKIDIDAVAVPEAPPKEEKKGFFGRLWGGVKSVASDAWEGAKNVANTVKEVAVTTAEVVGAGVKETVESLAQGQGLLDSLGDGVEAGGKKLYDQVIDPTLDKSVLGEDNEFQDKGAGALGPILTNRLAVGESVDIRIEAGATIPTELIGAPNVKVDGGGTMKIKRVAAVDENNQPIINKATGQPETRLEVELQLDGRVGGAYSASVGFKSTVQAGGYEAGIKAKAEAEAEAGLTGKLNLKLRFNPDSPEEMGNLGAMMKATAATGAAAAVPGIGTVFAAMNGENYKRSMETLPQHLESFGGEGGLYAQANASANLGVGVFKGKGKDKEGAEGAEGAEDKKETLADKAKGMAKEHGEDAVLDKLKLNLASVSVGAGGELRVGASKNFRTGEKTFSVTAEGKLQGEASTIGVGAGGSLSGQRKLDFVMGKDGALKDIKIEQKLTKEEFLKLQTTVEDVYGRPIDPGVIARMSESDTITVNYSVRPEVLADIKAKVGQGDPAGLTEAAKTILSAAITKDRFLVSETGIKTTHRDEFALRGGFELSLGAQIGVRGGLVLGHEQETVVK